MVQHFNIRAALYRFGFDGMEKDDETYGGGNAYDFGARICDPRLGRWLSVDPLFDMYPSISSYCFVLNTPISAYDPNGEVVIFVGGNHYSPANSSGDNSGYWRDYDKDGNLKFAFDWEVMKQFKDYKAVYRDGSLGGWAPFNIGVFDDETNMTAQARSNAGYFQGRVDAKPIIDNLKEGETIKVVTHSMGGAYAKGYIAALKAYIEENKLNVKIEIEVDFAPYQPDDNANSANASVPTFQFAHRDDGVAGNNKMKGASSEDTSSDPTGEDYNSGLERHGIFSFTGSLEKLGTLLEKVRKK